MNGNPALLRFHYQLSERRAAFWETALSGDSLFLEIPAGALVEGSKEGYVFSPSQLPVQGKTSLHPLRIAVSFPAAAAAAA